MDVTKSREITDFFSRIRDVASEVTLRQDSNEIVPHVTTARVRQVLNRELLQDAFKRLEEVEAGTVQVRSVSLYSSELRPEGPVHVKQWEVEMDEGKESHSS